ncbi:hypothetical protein LKK83_12230 [Phormidium sp. CCY1219]|nr:hypothetical protein [Phormidium sp. CCY1219]
MGSEIKAMPCHGDCQSLPTFCKHLRHQRQHRTVWNSKSERSRRLGFQRSGGVQW